jgi:hypothetical protein
MPQLKINIITTHVIDYMDWDTYIKEMFPKAPYETIIAEEELIRGSSWTHTTANLGLVDDLIAIENYLLKGENNWEHASVHTTDILNYLAYKGIIPKGHYTIKVPH